MQTLTFFGFARQLAPRQTALQPELMRIQAVRLRHDLFKSFVGARMQGNCNQQAAIHIFFSE